jgi:hypothetical protein
MSHTQPSPTAGVAQHHAAAMAAHAQANGHMPPAAIPAQGQKGVSLTTAQKIAALNEQVWLQIGMKKLHRRRTRGMEPCNCVLTV